MMTALRIHARGLLATSATLAIWTVLAIRSPELTYHFAPLIAAAAWPVLVRRDEAPRVHDSVAAGIGAFALVSGVAVLLAAGGYLEGPTFWNDGPALTEAFVFAGLGAAAGVAIARRPAEISAA